MKASKISGFLSAVLIFFIGAEQLTGAESSISENESVWRGFYLTAAPWTELKNGKISESTYRDESDTKFTEILWNEDMNFRTGARLGFGWWFAGLESDILFGIPKKSGKMSENWWTAADDPDFHLADFDCDVNLISDFEIDSRLKFDITPVKYIKIRPYAGFSYSLLDLKASDAEGKSGQISSRTPADSQQAQVYRVKGDRVDYKRETYDIYIGLEAGTLLFDRLSIFGDFRASPFLFINSVDHHYEGSGADLAVSESYLLNRFHSTFPKMTFGGSMEYRIWKELSAGASFYYTYIKELKGEEYYSASGSSYTSHKGYSARTSQSYWKAALYVKYRFKIGNSFTPKSNSGEGKKSGRPKVKNGKVQVRVY